MTTEQLQKWFREQHRLRLGCAMSEYVLRQIRSDDVTDVEFAIMGADARTGLPVRTAVSAKTIRAAFPEEFSSGNAAK